MWRYFLAALALSTTASAIPTLSSHVVHEKRSETPERWLKRDRVPPWAKLPVRIGLAQQNMAIGHEYLMDVSHPSSPNYGKHWTVEQVIEAFKPNDETVDTVHDWLVASGINEESITHSKNKAWFAFYASAKQMESLLHTEYWEYQDQHTGGIMPACDNYSVPASVRPHIDYITPGIKLLAPLQKPKEHQKRGLARRQWPYPGHPRPHPGPWPHPHPWPHLPKPHNPNDLSTCDLLITPACIAALYHIPRAHLADPSNSMGIYESDLLFWNQHDLNQFFKNFTQWIPQGTHPKNNLVDGGVAVTRNSSLDGNEAMLDLDIAYPISKFLTTHVQTKPHLRLLQYILRRSPFGTRTTCTTKAT